MKRYAERCYKKRRKYLERRERLKRRNLPFLFLDETGVDERDQGRRLHARSQKGTRVYGDVAGGRRARTSIVAGRLGERFVAPMLFTGTCTAAVFNAWLTHELLPSLTTQTVIVMDNAAFHKTVATRKLIEEAGHILLYLPPYSPDLNPIEPDWAVIKHHHRFNNTPLNDIIKMYRNKVV